MVQVRARLTDADVAALDGLVEGGRFAGRSDAMRAALVRLLDEVRRQEAIDAAYREGYGRYPQEEWIGEAGLASLAMCAAADRSAPAGPPP